MKTNIRLLLLLLTVIITSGVSTKQAAPQQPDVSFQIFYDQLSPYGEWVNYPNWGYVWIPDAGPDFVPYATEGHWILTDYGWTWMSDYIWGWAPFHYGRWDYDHYYGWFWIPDNEWGPAWVSWRRAEGYYGWAPMEPGISLSLSFGRGYDSHNDHWIFVRDRDIDRPDINNFYIGRTDRDRIVRRSSVINSTYVDNRRQTTYVTGPAREDIQKVTGRRVNPVAVQEYDRPGQDFSNGNFRIYRPEVMKNNRNENNASPSRITDLKDVKQPSERRGTNQSRDFNERTSQPSNSNPPQNVRSEVQPNNIRSQNTNPSQNVRRDVQPDNVRSQSTNPSQNIKRIEQPNNERSQNTNPSQNIRREQKQNNEKQQNINPSQNSRRDQQSNTSKESRNSKKEQQKRSNSKDKKENK
jgi:hypothetical protein